MSKELDLINNRLDVIEGLLRELIGRNAGVMPVAQASSVYTEIAQLKAAGVDIATHLKEKAQRRMRQDRLDKKLQRPRKGESSPQGETR